MLTLYFADDCLGDASAYPAELALVWIYGAKLQPLLRYKRSQAVGGDKRNNLAPQFTDHYFTGDYPTTLTDLTGRGKTDPKTLSLMREAS